MLASAISDYDIVRRLGAGSNSGQVYLARRLQNAAGDTMLAVEQINLNALVSANTRRQRHDSGSSSSSGKTAGSAISNAAATLVEIGRNESLLKQLDHQNIIKCFGSFLEGDTFHLLLEYCDGGSFKDAISEASKRGKPFREASIQRWVGQLVSALVYLHSRNIVHRSILPQNTFLARSNEAAKLGTFDLTKRRTNEKHSNRHKRASSSASSSSTGDMDLPHPFEYNPPEVITGGVHGCPGDVWSLGVLFYEISNLKTPFSGKNAQATCDAISNKPPEPFKRWYNADLAGFVSKFFEKDPAQRPTAEQLSTDPFLTKELPPSTTISRSLSSGAVAGDVKLSNMHTVIASDLFPIWKCDDFSSSVKESICATLKKENLSLDQLLTMSDDEIASIFPQCSVQKAVLTWRSKELNKTRHRLLSSIRTGDLVEISRILRNEVTRRQVIADGNLQSFANVIISPTDGDPPLHYAARHGRADVATFFMARHHARLDAENKQSDLPVHVAASEGKTSVVKFFLEKKAKLLESRGRLGQTPLLRAASTGRTKMVDFLLQKGADMTAKDQSLDEDSVLHLAAASGNVACCKLLLDNQPNLIELMNRHGETAVWSAVRKGLVDVASLLVNRWANVETKDRNGRTVLMQAAAEGNVKMATMLLEGGADAWARSLYQPDVEGLPIHLAAFNGHVDIVDLLLAHEKRLTPNKSSNKANAVTMLEATNRNGDTPLWRASFSGQLKVVERLVPPDPSCSERADVEARGQFGSTPLIAAAARGHLKVVDLLMKRGANYLAKDNSEQGAQAIHLAAAYGHIDVVRHLLECYPNLLDEEDGSGLTPIAYATFRYKPEVIRLLKERGARRCELALHLS